MRKNIFLSYFFFAVGMLLFMGCGEGDEPDPPGPTEDPTAAPDPQIVIRDIDNYWMYGPIFAPDGDGGCYLMDSDNHADIQEIYNISSAGEITSTDLNATNIAEAIGYVTFATNFQDLGADADGYLYFLQYITDDDDEMFIFRANIDSTSLTIHVSATQLAKVYTEIGIGDWYIPLLRTQMRVRPDGTIWLYTNDGTNHIVALLYYVGTELNYTWYQIPTTTTSPSHALKIGTADDGDLFVTDMEAGIIWRCDEANGVSAYIDLTGFPNTVSGFAQDDDGGLHFATNYILEYEIDIIEGGDGSVDLSTTWFIDGDDWLFFAPFIRNQYWLFGWEATTFVADFGGDGVPTFWRFMTDPVSGQVWTLDETAGDLYILDYTVE